MRGKIDWHFPLNQQIANDLADAILKCLGLVVRSARPAFNRQLLAEFIEELLEAGLVQIAHGQHLNGTAAGCKRRVQSRTDLIGMPQGVLPYAENLPTARSEGAVGGNISRGVRSDFGAPVMQPTAWHPAVPAAAVPEAAVDKDGEALAGKDEVGVAWERLVAAPTGDAGGAKD
jgi:hypothetical protein